MLRQDISARDVIAILRRRWVLITLITLTGGTLGFALLHILPKRFTSQTLVLVQQPAVSPIIVPNVLSDDINQRLAAMQQQILSSSRLEPVIQELGLYHDDISRVDGRLGGTASARDHHYPDTGHGGDESAESSRIYH